MNLFLRATRLPLAGAGQLAIVVLLAASSPASGRQWQNDTLYVQDIEDLVRSIQESNPLVRAAGLVADGLQLRGDQVAQLPDPIVSLGIQPIPVVTARGSQRSQWQVRQDLPYPGKRGLRREVWDWGARGARAGVDVLTLDLVESARLAFVDLIRIRRQDRLIREFQESLRQHEGVAETHYRVGTGLQQAILKAQVERNALTNRRLELEKQGRSAVERLSALANRPVVISDTLVAWEPLPFRAADGRELVELAGIQRPEWAHLEAATRQADATILLARREWYPDFSLSLTYFEIADTSIPASADGRDAIAIGVGIRVPLYRDRLRAKLEEAELSRLQIDARAEALDTAIRTDIADLRQQIARAVEQLQLFEDALIPQARTTRAATISAYTTGRTDFLDLLDAERMLFDLRWAAEVVRSDLLKAEASLVRAVGNHTMRQRRQERH